MNSLRRDILTAYLAAAARVLSWIVVTALVYRRLGKESFAVLALVRTTIGLLNYTTLGLGPATIRMLAMDSSPPQSKIIYSSAVALAAMSAAGAALLALGYAAFFTTIHALPTGLSHANFRPFVLTMGLGAVARLASEAFGAGLQVRGRIALDNLLITGGELFWLALCLVFLRRLGLAAVGASWLASGLFVLAARITFANCALSRTAFSFRAIQAGAIKGLLTFGLLVALAQAADLLYAPSDNILINRFINPVMVATYAPAIQIDAGLLLLVAGLASVLLPHTALALAQGQSQKVRMYYITGTLLSLGLLITAAAAVWRAAPYIFQLWLHDPLPATQAILPLVLIHTVVGGSSAVGRSVLLALGRVKPFTTAVLVAGAANVLLSFIFVYYFRWGLRGIILGTILAVVGRCAIWTPWYVMKTLRHIPRTR